MANGNGDNRQRSISAFEQELSQVSPFELITLSDRPLDDVAVHDFAFYEFLLPTELGYGGPRDQGLSDQGLAYLDAVEAGGTLPGMLDVLASFLIELETVIRNAMMTHYGPLRSDPMAQFLIQSLYQDAQWLLTELFQIYLMAGTLRRVFLSDLMQSIVEEIGWQIDFKNIFSWATWALHATQQEVLLMPEDTSGLPDWETRHVNHRAVLAEWRALTQRDDLWVAGYDYPFEVFPSRTVNMGLRLIYRQTWKPLAKQKGDVVKTIPLAAGQKDRVSTKIVRRRKATSTIETVRATEETTESTESTKDSNEIVAEAADTFNWKVDLEVHAGIPMIGGSASTSFGGTSEERSKATSSFLSESMQKMASKVRRETKVVVSQEQEEAFERESSSEIANTNNEMAITYEYYLLQQQYEVFTLFLIAQQALVWILVPPNSTAVIEDIIHYVLE